MTLPTALTWCVPKGPPILRRRPGSFAKLFCMQTTLYRFALLAALGLWGCAASVPVSARSLDGQLRSGGLTRDYQLYVPPSYTSGQAWPLVISLHGFAEPASHLREISHWNALAEREGFLVAYPSGTGTPLSWRTYTAGTQALSRDTQFISDLIAQLARDYRLDPRRIYVNGFSNGGGMGDLLSCELSEQVAALGSVSGAICCPRISAVPRARCPCWPFTAPQTRWCPTRADPPRPFKSTSPRFQTGCVAVLKP